MSIEASVPRHIEDIHGLPEALPEHVTLAKTIDTQFTAWGADARSHHPAKIRKPFGDTIIEDCRVIENIEKEIDAHYRFSRSEDDIEAHRARIISLQDIAKQAHNKKLDALTIENEAYRTHFDTVFSWINDQNRQTSLKDAYILLRRLFIAREQLGLKTGTLGFDVAQLNFVLERTLKDDRRLNP